MFRKDTSHQEDHYPVGDTPEGAVLVKSTAPTQPPAPETPNGTDAAAHTGAPKQDPLATDNEVLGVGVHATIEDPTQPNQGASIVGNTGPVSGETSGPSTGQTVGHDDPSATADPESQPSPDGENNPDGPTADKTKEEEIVISNPMENLFHLLKGVAEQDPEKGQALEGLMRFAATRATDHSQNIQALQAEYAAKREAALSDAAIRAKELEALQLRAANMPTHGGGGGRSLFGGGGSDVTRGIREAAAASAAANQAASRITSELRSKINQSSREAAIEAEKITAAIKDFFHVGSLGKALNEEITNLNNAAASNPEAARVIGEIDRYAKSKYGTLDESQRIAKAWKDIRSDANPAASRVKKEIDQVLDADPNLKDSVKKAGEIQKKLLEKTGSLESSLRAAPKGLDKDAFKGLLEQNAVEVPNANLASTQKDATKIEQAKKKIAEEMAKLAKMLEEMFKKMLAKIGIKI